MSSGKLDQSLDEILKTSRGNKRNNRGGGRGGANRAPAHAAPVGGIQKSNKNKKAAVKGAPAAPTAAGGKVEHKLMVSGLPRDLGQDELNSYFTQAVGSKPKKLTMQYNANGSFAGAITVFFFNEKQVNKAAEKLDKVKIDNRPVRVEKFVNAADAPAPAPSKTLADRITQPKKDQPKPVTATKGSDTRGRGAKGRRGRGGRFQRGPKKTVEELDAEMEDYFPADQNKLADDAMVTNGGAPAAGAGDAAMDDDEML